MTRGYLAIVLHAHLPFVRHPDDPTVMEQRWLNEAILETYLPLLEIFEGLRHDGIPFRCTVSLSAPLLHMLRDALLRERFEEHLEHMEALAQRELERTHKEPWYRRLAEMYADRLHRMANLWRGHGGDLVSAFQSLQQSGCLEVITSTATHAFFPLMEGLDGSMRAQVHVAADHYEQHFGIRPQGMWLGECGFVDGVDELLREAAVRYTILDTHALLHADRPPIYGAHAPLYCPSGVAVFGRDPETSELVWSAKGGYPGDPHYRDFYRDIGYDLPEEYIGPWLHAEGHRLATGFKYHAITHDQMHDKWVYDPEKARERVGLHAADFRQRCRARAEMLAPEMDRPPIILSPYDAELYGHWWFEGPLFLNDLFRQLHFDQDEVVSVTPAEYLNRHSRNQMAVPSASSWGEKGFNEWWLNPSNAWVYRHLHIAAERMTELACRFSAAGPLQARALNQAARELMLAQSSDWAFIMRAGTTVSYAERRTNDHIRRFTRLYEDLLAGHIDAEWLSHLEVEDNLFPRLDWRVYAT